MCSAFPRPQAHHVCRTHHARSAHYVPQMRNTSLKNRYFHCTTIGCCGAVPGNGKAASGGCGYSVGFFVMFAPEGASDAVRFAFSDVLRLCRKVMGCVPRSSRPQAHHVRRTHHARSAHHVPRMRNTSLKNPAALCATGFFWSGRRDSNSLPPPWQGGALPNELRPRILPQRGRWCLRPESNWRHADFQSAALPTELPRHMATRNGLEPSTSSVTGWRSKPTELPGRMVGTTGLEPVTPCL